MSDLAKARKQIESLRVWPSKNGEEFYVLKSKVLMILNEPNDEKARILKAREKYFRDVHLEQIEQKVAEIIQRLFLDHGWDDKELAGVTADHITQLFKPQLFKHFNPKNEQRIILKRRGITTTAKLIDLHELKDGHRTSQEFIEQSHPIYFEEATDDSFKDVWKRERRLTFKNGKWIPTNERRHIL